MNLKQIRELQIEFQRAVGFPVDSILESDRNEMSEKYLFKAIEEIIELRKEFPSALNPWAKNQTIASNEPIKKEFSDVLLFLMNFANVWKLSNEEILEYLYEVQLTNFLHVKQKKIKELNDEILSIPGYVSGVGQGNLFAKYIFIGLNPGKSITHGYKFWSNPEDGSSKILLPLLEELGIKSQSYFTNLVKCTTLNNSIPSVEVVDFWKPFLDIEVNILKIANPEIKLFVMGNAAKDFLPSNKFVKITHPAAILRTTNKLEDYKNEIKKATALNNRGL